MQTIDKEVPDPTQAESPADILQPRTGGMTMAANQPPPTPQHRYFYLCPPLEFAVIFLFLFLSSCCLSLVIPKLHDNTASVSAQIVTPSTNVK